ncbi:MAG: matrixin family metalloprotease [Polyangiaceae bacterium]|nr:matrixin family metalloprotease [Polyangiaceae bacterium]
MNPRRALVASALTALLFGSSEAQAFCRKTTCTPADSCPRSEDGCLSTGIPLRWPSNEIDVAFHEDVGLINARPAEVLAALRQAFHVWSDVTCPTASGATQRTSLRFREREQATFPINPVLAEPESYRKSNVVFFRDAGWPYRTPDATIATTRVQFSVETGIARSAQLELNSANYVFTLPDEVPKTGGIRTYDLVAVATHEVGHFIGLDHSRAPESIMAERYCEQATRCARPPIEARRLADDDVLAVCSLFPPGSRGAGNPEDSGSGGCSASGSASSSPVGWMTLLFGAATLSWLRRRSRV